MPPAPLLLLVDDAPEIVLIVTRLGKRAGHEIVSCHDAQSAWVYLDAAPESARPDLVLLDLNLPRMSGLDLCRQIRESPTLQNIPIALFTAWDRPDDVAAGLEAGVDFVAPKDLLARPQEWLTRIDELLARLRGRAEGSPVVRVRGEPTTAINLLLRQPAVRQLGPEVVRILFHRAAVRTGITADDWLLSDALGLREGLTETAPAATIMRLAEELIEQVWGVLGAAAIEPFREPSDWTV